MSYINNKTYTYTTSSAPTSSQFNQRYTVTSYVYAVDEAGQPLFYLGVVIQQTDNVGVNYPRYLLWVYNGLTTPLYVNQDNIFTRFFNPMIIDGIIQPPTYNTIFIYQMQVANSIVHHMVFENNMAVFSESMPIYRYQITEAGIPVYGACDWRTYFNMGAPLYYTTLVPSSNPTPTPTPIRPTYRPTLTPTPTPTPEESWWQRNKWWVIILIVIFVIIIIILIWYGVSKGKEPEVVVATTYPPPPIGYPPPPPVGSTTVYTSGYPPVYPYK